jgi:RNA polymerase-interacting CarD/CdnL/TRCF family regulator
VDGEASTEPEAAEPALALLMDFKRGFKFVYPPSGGVATVLEVYSAYDEEWGIPVDMLRIQPARGSAREIEKRLAQQLGRPLMSVGEARQILSLLANTFAPTERKASIKLHEESGAALKSWDAMRMATVLRELMIRSKGGGGAPVRISFEEASDRNKLTSALCSELKVVLDTKFMDKVGMVNGCEEAIGQMTRRINPNPDRDAVSRYKSVYKSFPVTALASELRTIARSLKKKSTSDNVEHRADLNARQHALLHVLDARSRRSPR